jgi:hypothetical protein
VVNSDGHRAEVSDGPSGFAGFLAVLSGGELVMKFTAGIASWALGEHLLSAHPARGYTSAWRLTLASTEVSYPSLVPEIGKPEGDQGQLTQLAAGNRF